METNKQDKIFSSKTLTYFLQLTKTMSYTQAAQILGITQPALTQQIKKLERAVGAPLFYSVGKKLHLSDAGYTMLDATHQIYETLNWATDEIQQSTSATQGEITIGLLSSLDERIFTDFAIKFYQANPGIKLILHQLTRDEIWERLEGNTIDLAVMYLPDDSIKNWKPYDSKKIINEELLFLHKKDNPSYTKRKKVKNRDTLKEQWVTYPPAYYLNSLIREAFKNTLADRPESVAHFTQPEQLLSFAKQTGVNTALPSSFVKAHADEEIGILSFDPAIKFEMDFVFRKDKQEVPRIKAFFDAFDVYLSEKSYDQHLKEILASK